VVTSDALGQTKEETFTMGISVQHEGFQSPEVHYCHSQGSPRF